MAPVKTDDAGTGWTPPFKPETPIGHHGDNVFALMGNARTITRQLDWPKEWIDALLRRARGTHSYREACAVLAEHFTLAGEDPFAFAEDIDFEPREGGR